MDGRPLVSYADITQPYDASNTSIQPPQNKKRKKQPAKTKSLNRRGDSGQGVEERKIVEESRQLTHDEIWDDSALVDAWNAATEEYEALHGPSKDWKHQKPSTSAPLWYNIPPTPENQTFTTVEQQDPLDNLNDDDDEPYTNDINASTSTPHFPQHALTVESYDPSHLGPEAAAAGISQDEAFSRALNAMYWGGYWTAVYHCHRKLVPGGSNHQATSTDEERGGEDSATDDGDPMEEEEVDDAPERFISTQR